VLPGQFSTIRRTLVNDGVFDLASYDNDREEAIKRRRREEDDPESAIAATQPRKRIILVRTRPDGSKYK